jgi:hypothetical protein
MESSERQEIAQKQNAGASSNRKSLSTFAELALGALRQWETGENGRREGRGLLFLAGMANGVRFFAPPYWKFEACARRAARNPHYDG